LAEGHDVWITAREQERGRQAADELGGRFVQLDVTDQASVDAAAERVANESGRLDVLINNAGIPGGFVPALDVTPEDVRRVYETNVFGVVRVTRAFVPLLQFSPHPVIVNVSSGMGSLTITNEPGRLESTLVGIAYPSSKSALNMITTMYAKAFPDVRINAVDPGYTATDLNGHRGSQTVEQGADVIVRMAMIDGTGPTGTFVVSKGVVPW
jgi:NAD(P)-dependent dehydrogenase (short-subunit alcohol dehydrogenase family)